METLLTLGLLGALWAAWRDKPSLALAMASLTLIGLALLFQSHLSTPLKLSF